MPVNGFVDPDRHRACFRCGKWFELDEGSAADVGSTRGATAAANIIGAFVHLRCSEQRFVCFACQRRRRLFQCILWATFAAVILLVLLLQSLKII